MSLFRAKTALNYTLCAQGSTVSNYNGYLVCSNGLIKGAPGTPSGICLMISICIMLLGASCFTNCSSLGFRCTSNCENICNCLHRRLLFYDMLSSRVEPIDKQVICVLPRPRAYAYQSTKKGGKKNRTDSISQRGDYHDQHQNMQHGSEL